MKPLLTYIVTQSVLPRLLRTLAFQKSHFAEAFEQYDKIILTDFKTQIDVGLKVVRRDICPEGKYSMPVARNAAFKVAEEGGYEWHFDGDADRVVLDCPKEFPEPGLGYVSMHHFLKDETEKDILEKYALGKINFRPSSFFVTHREFFTKLRFCEEFVGYGYDDIDFVYNVCRKSKVPSRIIKAHGFHLWHEERTYEGFNNYEGFRENGRLFEERRDHDASH